MLENTRAYLKQWHKATEPRARLQHTYLALAVGVLALAGIVSLFDTTLGHAMAGLAASALGVFLINAIIWALLQSITISYLTDRRASKK